MRRNSQSAPLRRNGRTHPRETYFHVCMTPPHTSEPHRLKRKKKTRVEGTHGKSKYPVPTVRSRRKLLSARGISTSKKIHSRFPTTSVEDPDLPFYEVTGNGMKLEHTSGFPRVVSSLPLTSLYGITEIAHLLENSVLVTEHERGGLLLIA